VACNGTTVNYDYLDWTNAPDWSYPKAGTYSGVSVEAYYGNCYGETATCSGKLTVAQVAVSSSSSKPSSSSAQVVNVSCDMNYRTVPIGDQVWMAENLNCNVSGSKCYNNSEANCATYGRLYDWATAMNLPASCNSSTCASQINAKHRGICPSGWHIPSNAEWDKLYRFADGTSGTESPYTSSTAGRYLKTSDWGGNDEYGFSALPGGYVSVSSFDDVGGSGEWWSSSELSSFFAYYRLMTYNYEGAGYNNLVKSYLFSVRCLQD
jgi:uncharacterized protein (TIGR02145 family)